MQLRVAIPAVENSSPAMLFRGQDILTSRKGLTVESTNTCEGRFLVLACILAWAIGTNSDADHLYGDVDRCRAGLWVLILGAYLSAMTRFHSRT